ncbi:5'-AMP-activated protein kinase subunit gamma-2 [Platysternon megacephalum]|uniref:5'-AMP-activated protein kinase subunit gamma-2 n=1 Tax=Platysternon megacephalum TaxID=55544 RepID=A0A4D9E328_9SAUR|nr:5'-AMP-activated protein kinase subunit gamma-2 [Platysternon megacephalum]
MGRIIPSVTVLLLVFVTSKAFEIKITPEYVAAQIGDKLELTCSTIGCESPSFSWRSQLDKPRGGSVTNNGNSSILTMDPVGIENEQEYLCCALCDNVKKEKSIKVDVYSFPSDPVIEISTPLNVGEKASITCMVPKVYPSERLKMHLEKDGSVLEMKEFYEEGITETTETKSLTLTFIPTFEDIGKAITCVAQLPIDEMEFEPKKRQTSQRLSVNFGPQNANITVSPSNTTMQGETLMLTCRTTSNPPARIVWGKELEDSSVQHIIDKDTLIIPHAQMSDSGLFICEAMNDATNKSERTTVVISVQDGPRNTTVSVTPSTTVKEGGAVTMTCTSYGNPAPKISWTKHLISGELQFLSENATLTINNVKAEDLGLYECEGVNQFGREKKTVDLIVQVPPQNTTALISPSDNVDEGENIAIMSTTYSNSPPQTVPQKIHPSNTTILSSQNDTSRRYRVIKNYTGIYPVTYNETGNNTDVIEIAVVEMVKETDYTIIVIVVLSCLSTMAIPALAILVYMSRKAKINGSYSPVNAPKPNV